MKLKLVKAKKITEATQLITIQITTIEPLNKFEAEHIFKTGIDNLIGAPIKIDKVIITTVSTSETKEN